jgi:PKHD-type hydroxylase
MPQELNENDVQGNREAKERIYMLICIDNLLDAATIARLQSWLSFATFEDGRATAGATAAKVKLNEQVSDDPSNRDPQLEKMQDLVEDLLWRHGFFMAAAQPKEIHPPLFSRYTTGMRYGTHMDNSTMNNMRIDLSLTIFLSDPADYDGGELVINFPTGERSIKLAAGSAVLYPTTALHQVTEVTRGQRLVAVTWIRSLIRDAAKREILLDLKTVQRRLTQQIGKTPEIDLLGKTYTNLLRRWIED